MAACSATSFGHQRGHYSTPYTTGVIVVGIYVTTVKAEVDLVHVTKYIVVVDKWKIELGIDNLTVVKFSKNGV